MISSRRQAHLAGGALLLGVGVACTTSSSAVRDAFLTVPPHYAGVRSSQALAAASEVGIVPITFQPGSTRPVFDPPTGTGSALTALLADMNAFADSLTLPEGAAVVRLLDAGGGIANAPVSSGAAPDVRFGCNFAGELAAVDCPPVRFGEDTQIRPLAATRLSVQTPSPEWLAWSAGVMESNSVPTMLLLTLELGIYRPRINTFLRTKWVDMGTNYVLPLPWLTPIEHVTVLQLTGARFDSDGRPVRIGVEGLVAGIPRHLENVEIISDENIRALHTKRRTDLPGEPLVWKEAMRELVKQLTQTDAVSRK